MDQQTKIESLKDMIQSFCEAREWDQFHGAKDLAIGLVTEASELLEHFRFKDEREIEASLLDPIKRSEISDELADSLFFVLRFSQRYKIDLTTALGQKMAKNAKKYPVEKAKGNNKKYSEFEA